MIEYHLKWNFVNDVFLFSPYKCSSLTLFAPTTLPLLAFLVTSLFASHENLSTFTMKIFPPLDPQKYILVPNYRQELLYIDVIFLPSSKYSEIFSHENLSAFRFLPWFSFHLTTKRFPPCHESLSTLLWKSFLLTTKIFPPYHEKVSSLPWKSFHFALNPFPPLNSQTVGPQGFQVSY